MLHWRAFGVLLGMTEGDYSEKAREAASRALKARCESLGVSVGVEPTLEDLKMLLSRTERESGYPLSPCFGTRYDPGSQFCGLCIDTDCCAPLTALHTVSRRGGGEPDDTGDASPQTPALPPAMPSMAPKTGKRGHSKALDTIAPGSILKREWKGRLYEVIVTGEKTFIWEGVEYPSLISVVRAITGGNNWSGKRFFRL